jgi:myo-inositol-1(or 4)-monophosphatase
MDDSKLKEIHDYLIELAHKAGEMITTAKPGTSTVDLKKNCML